MLKFITLLSILLISIANYAQNIGDTITIQTYEYNSTTRDSVFDFSTLPNVSFEKIIMEYSIRCTDGLISNSGNTNLGCGEWDYSCNTYIEDSSKIDSVLYKHPNLTISNFSGTTYNYTSIPTYDFYQFTQNTVTLNSITSENSFQILSGTNAMNNVLDGSNQSGKSQFLYTAAELIAAGFNAGDIDGFFINSINGGTSNFFRVKLKETTSSVLTPNSPELNGYTEVFYNNYTFVTGQNRIQFYQPFTWNGTDNIIVEFSFTNTVPTTDIQFEGTTSSDLGLFANNGYNINLSGNPITDITTASMSTISNEITVSFWAYGDVNDMPANTSIIHATDANNQRSFNLHLPWSNSRIYFDCGWLGTGYDRIDKAASVAEIEGQWNHWAVTKNTATGAMKVYLNGSLWHSGTGKTNPIEIVEMVIGGTNSGSFNYKGQLDEVRIWNKELTATEIADWMNINITPSHPQYPNLIAYYKLDNGTGSNLLESINNGNAVSPTSDHWKMTRGKDLTRFFSSTTMRPSISIIRGTYDLTIGTVNVMDSIVNSPNTMTEYTIISHPGVILDDEVIETSSTQAWEAIPQNVYDALTGNVISTIPVATENTAPTPMDLDYYRRWASRFEIMSFVTPYGIGLDLGMEGKTYSFDITDYAPLFNGQKRIYMTGGVWQEDMDIRFKFIVGTPPRDVVDIDQLWYVAQRNYTDINNDRYFPAKDIQLDANGQFFEVKSVITGHGQEGEFIPRNHMINVNGGASEFTWQVWKDCAENPIYPQGGTWVYDRAGWCPGAPSDVHISDITSYVSAGQVANIDYDVAIASGDSRYLANHQLVTYGAINHTLDAAIIEVREPSNRIEFARFNSICHDPKITIKNTGSEVLTKLTLKYWVNNSTSQETYTWNGSLAFGETEIVTLPSNWWMWNSLLPSGNVFHVELSAPNDGIDEYIHNNHYASKFNIPEVMPSTIVIYFKTNTKPQENNYQITDEQGNVVFSRSNMTANTLYRDTVELPLGCYNYHVNDTDGDGLSWWANSDGNGYTKFFSPAVGTVKQFNGDFGDNIHFNFTIDYPLSYEDLNDLNDLEIYPNPTRSSFTLEGKGLSEASVVLFDNTGKAIQIPTEFYSERIKFNSASLDPGIYYIKVNREDRIETLKIVIE